MQHKWAIFIPVIALLSNRTFCYEVSNLTFPDSILFGAGTSAYQIEGAWNESGKGVGEWDYLTHRQQIVISDGSNADIASDSYHKYQDDIALLKELGVAFYRFSISWPRILPSGFTNEINQDGVNYYNNLIDGLLEAGIQPLVTMYHFDGPQALQYIGGFNNPKVIDYVVDYADLLFSLFGDRVKTWITFNEPVSFCVYFPYVYTAFGTIIPNGVTEYLCMHNVIKAHAKIYRSYQKKYKYVQKGKISMAIQLLFAEPGTDSPADVEAAQRKLLFDFGWCAYPLVYGDYPSVMKETIGNLSEIQGYPFSRLPKFTFAEKLLIKGTYDFIGVNHYTSRLTIDASTEVKEASFLNDALVEQYSDPSWGNSSASWLFVYPEGFRKLLVYVKETYNNPEIIVTENGYADDPGVINDEKRVEYYQSYLSELLKAVLEDGVNVTAYSAWSLLDNFEWFSGYSVRFGLYHVDFDSPNRTRTPKDSAFYYKNVIETRCLVDVCEE